jgi:glyoxylase-like metal-dependent hydrolase (beta-lactamase superfamily II)
MIQVEQHGPVTAIRMARSFLGRPLEWTAAYYVDGLLIDTGPHHTAGELVRVLRNVQVDQIVVTHGYEDHTGGLGRLLQHFPHAKVFAARRTIPLLKDPERIGMQRYRRLIWGKPEPVQHVLPLDDLGDRIFTGAYEFRVVETPGHTRDHISLFEANQRWLFCGDTFAPGRDRALSTECDLFAMMGSLRTLAELRPERVFSGSGDVVRTPLPELHAKIGNYVKLCRDVARLEAAGFEPPDIVRRIVRSEPPIRRWTFGHVSANNLVNACREYNAMVFPPHAQSSAPSPADDQPISDSLRQ